MIAALVFVAVLAVPAGIAQAERNGETEVAAAGAPAPAPTTEAPTTTAAAPATTEAPTTTAAPTTVPVTAAPTTTAAPAPTTAAPTTTTAPVAPAPATDQADGVPVTATAPTDIMLSAFDGSAQVAAGAPTVDERAVAQKNKEARKATEPPPNPLYSLSYSDQQFLTCVRWRESRNNYTVVNSSSGAGGAYQFLQTTWNNTAAHMGRYDLIGLRPNWAAPIDQDTIAVHLIQWYGRSPWAGPGC